MNPSQVICIAAVLLICVLVFYKCPRKESFHMPSDMIEAKNVPLPAERSPLISSLSEGYFRGGEGFADFVASPGLPAQPVDNVAGKYYSPQEMMPVGTMDSAGVNDDGSIPNQNVNLPFVNLAKSKYTDCTLVFNVGIDEGVSGPINSIHQFKDPHYLNYSLISGTEYDRKDPHLIWVKGDSN